MEDTNEDRETASEDIEVSLPRNEIWRGDFDLLNKYMKVKKNSKKREEGRTLQGNIEQAKYPNT